MFNYVSDSIPVKKEPQTLKNFNWKPEWDRVPKSIYSDLVQNHAELAKVQNDLKNKHAHQQNTFDLMDEKWDDIIKKQDNLKEVFISSAKTISSNQASILRFAEKINDHKKQHESLDAQINELKFQKEKTIIIIADMEKYVNIYGMYEQFLEKLVGIGTDFNSVGDILNRYECLENVRDQLVKSMKENLEDIISARKQMVNITEEKSSLLRNLDNKLIKMQVKIKEVKDNSKRWEIIVQKLKLMIITKVEEAEKFKAGCYVMYNNALTRRQQTDKYQIGYQDMQMQDKQPQILSKNDIEGQLDYIQKSIQFYKEVLRIASTSNSKST